MGQRQERVKDLETDCGHRKEVDRNELLGVILQECAPSLRRRFAAAHHVFADAALTDVDAGSVSNGVQRVCNGWNRGNMQLTEKNGGDDETRTRDLCRDS